MESGKWILPNKIVKDDASVAVVRAIHELRHHVIFEGRISVGTDEHNARNHQIRYRRPPPFVPVSGTGVNEAIVERENYLSKNSFLRRSFRAPMGLLRSLKDAGLSRSSSVDV